MSRAIVLPRLAALLLGAATFGCSNAPTTAPSGGEFHVSVFNDSHVALTDIRVATGEGSSFTIDRLAPGDLSATYDVSALHVNPSVMLEADGQALSLMPIEGFVPGFNPPLEPGSYVITISVSDPPRSISVAVSQPVEDLTQQP